MQKNEIIWEANESRQAKSYESPEIIIQEFVDVIVVSYDYVDFEKAIENSEE